MTRPFIILISRLRAEERISNERFLEKNLQDGGGAFRFERNGTLRPLDIHIEFFLGKAWRQWNVNFQTLGGMQLVRFRVEIGVV